MKTITLFVTIILTGLSAGFFYSWLVTVIPGTRKVADLTYLQTMQSINKEILNPYFAIIFFGPLIALAISSYMHWENKTMFTILLTSTMIYLIGSIGVTGVGNIPLNNQLETMNLMELNNEALQDFRVKFEKPWNRFHVVRTSFAILTFALTVASLFLKGPGEKAL